ncbi:alanine--tRNA ligase [Sporolactobacillus sp. THM19-2]|jgi:alanyl-tRNA synthetase|uniref:alanine--tRNA ligase n=1 Tax=Sporolactobacillus sp. THM19-2 TaxID=2511171 RepID=UPI0010202F19|nr:alanine--tRNA ligase [Sporolactobacillus sp. THM19-2]RYL94737.1 alanine--tRNA ligase [Sporolactobacillus sp. THM19-2]
MKQLSSSEVRQMFLDFFRGKGHSVEPSASLIPVDDPSLLWINSGVATLKKYFDGRIVPKNPRICNAQKAIRTNDIENVGYTARHHTFFEMLGNFSVGDYFKKEAITWAWEFLTSPDWIGFDPDRLSVTIYPKDDEAYQLWHEKIGLPEERIIKLEHNFWDIGEGPSGPNTEIFYDRGEAFGNDPNDPELFPGGENERYLEVWNLVFSQFNHNPDGTHTPLPKKNIDTGLGLERMVSVIQGGETNFDTDLFLPIIHKIEEISGKTYKKGRKNTPFKVIADHVRAVSFAIADGALPSNEGRGYVLRRLIRRAVRYAMDLGINKPFMYELVPVVADIMKDYYKEVLEKAPYVQKIIYGEEKRFQETIHDGIAILRRQISEVKAKGGSELSGEDVFKLYDTFGFPVELTGEYAKKDGLSIDQKGFEAELEKQRERARTARKDQKSMHVQSATLRNVTVKSTFVGYDRFTVEDAKVLALVNDHEAVENASEGQKIRLILDRTPFYAEMGGQVADQGTLKGDTALLRVTDVQQAPNGQNLHSCIVVNGEIHIGDRVKAQIDGHARLAIQKNHTATHLLDQALKDVLGPHVNQAGSYVSADRLRFDFSHYGQVTEAELHKVERTINEKIWAQLPVTTKEMPIDEAKKSGAVALFGEKYGKIVRVVNVGDYSLELCGGCHVRNTAELGLFTIVSEAGIGAGTRRIEALTGEKAYEKMNQEKQELVNLARSLKVTADQLPEKIGALQLQIKALEKDNTALMAKLGNAKAAELEKSIRKVGNISYLAAKVDAMDMNQLRTMADDLKNHFRSLIVVLASVEDGKVHLVSGVTKDLISKGFHAGKIIKEVASVCGGGGGGRPDMAQAGGRQPEKVGKALDSVADFIKETAVG